MLLEASLHDRACRLRADPDRPVTSIATGLTALIVATAAIAPSQTVAQTWNGTGSDYGTAGNWTPNNVPDAAGENAVLDNTGATEPIVDLGAGTFSPTSVTINGATSYTIQNGTLDLANGLTNNSSADQTISAIISGAGGLSQDGDGTLTLLGTNTYTGTTTVSAGTLAVTGAGTLASTAVTVNGGTLQTDGGALSATANVTVNDGTFAIEGDETINLLTNNAGANTTVAAGTTLSADVIDNLDGTLTVFGTLDATTRVETASGSFTYFRGDGTLGASNLFTEASRVGFFDSSTAGTGTITMDRGRVQFLDNSTAGNATITADGGQVEFFDSSTAGSATITVNVGFAQFSDNSTAGTSTITVDGGRVQFRDNSTAGSSIITNNSDLSFENFSTAGSAVITNNAGGTTIFIDNSTAGDSTITNNGLTQFFNDSTAGTGTITVDGGRVQFFNDSTADNATITNNDGLTQFFNASTAGSAAITNNAGGTMEFFNTSTAGDARLINNAGGIGAFIDNSTAGSSIITNNSDLSFEDSSTADNARLINNAGGTIVFSDTMGPLNDNRISAGSIAGRGAYILGANELTVGGNDDTTEVSGEISGAGGSLVKEGTGTLTLSGVNTYTGATMVSGGTLALTGAGTIASTDINVTGGTLQTDGGALSATANVTVNDGTFAIEGDETINLLTNNADAITTVAAGTTLSADIIGNNFGATFTVSGTLDATTRVENAFGSVIDFRGDGTLGASTLLNDNGIVEFFDSSSAGTGVIFNNGGFTQFFDDSTADNATITSNAGFIQFFNNSTAGSATITVSGGFAQFGDSSTAGTSTITVDGGRVQFRDNSTAGSATITNNNFVQFVDDGTAGSGTITNNSITQFRDNSTADSSIITNNFVLEFEESSIAGNAAITNTAGGTTTFIDNSTAGDARLINLAGGTIDFSGTTGPLDDNRISAGSIAGGGAYILGANALTVGGNNDTTEVNGEISGAGGSLVKQGTGTLTLSGVNTHTGGTTISGGTLTVSSGGSLVSDTTVNAGSTFNIDNGAMVAGINNAGTTNASGVINGSVANAGIFGPGGRGAIGTVSVNGDFVQTASGSLAFDVDGTGGTSDLISVAGTADLAGTVDVILNGADPVGLLTILSAQGGVTDSGLMLGGVPVFANPLTNIALVFPNTNDVALSFTLDAIAGTFNPNQTAILNTINTINTSDVGGTGPMISALFALGSIEETASALDQLSPEIALNTETATQLSAANFADSLLSCPVTGGAHAAIREGDCLWVRPHGRFLDADGTANRIGFEETAGGISIGGQYEAWTNWHAGLALGYEHGDLDTNSGAGATSDRFHAGGTLKYQHGAMMIAGAIYGGVDTYDTTRTIGFGGFSAVNTADYNIAHVGAKLRAAYLMEHGGFYAKPLVDVNFTHLDRDGFTEDGNPAATLTVHGGSDTYFSVSPAIEIGSEHAMAEGWRLRTHLKAGVTVYSQDQNTLTARFAGAPAAAPSFQITSELDDVFADFEAGALLQGEKAAIELGYQGRISSDASQHGGFIKGSLKF